MGGGRLREVVAHGGSNVLIPYQRHIPLYFYLLVGFITG